MTSFAVVGTSPFHDTSVAAGPFRSYKRALAVSLDLDSKGWNAEVVELLQPAEIATVVNDEGSESA